MRENTLVNMQLKSRKIKTKDIIKMLRPKPKNEKVAKAYKDIIENNAKSDTLLTKRSQNEKEAIRHFDQNIEKMPVNMLIRNLRMYKKTDNPTQTRERILKTLEKIDVSEKVVNPFDFVTIAVEVPSLEVEMTSLIRRFMSNTNFTIEGKTAVLFDVSGSMDGQGEVDGFKNLVLLAHIFDPKDLYFFAGELHKVDREILKLIKNGDISRAKSCMVDPYNGTALLDSLKEVAEMDYDNIIVISDEVTWDDDEEINYYRDATKGKRIIAINPVKYKGTVFRNKFLALASLEAKIFLHLRMLVDWKGFKKWIIENYS
jgi:hypothetical protein